MTSPKEQNKNNAVIQLLRVEQYKMRKYFFLSSNSENISRYYHSLNKFTKTRQNKRYI